MWLIILSDQLPVEALVSRYLTNKLMGREPISKRPEGLYPKARRTGQLDTFGINPGFPGLFPTSRQVAHALLTLSPLDYRRNGNRARLACLIHAASVHSEPGSNSPLKVKAPNCPSTRLGKTVERPPAARLEPFGAVIH